MSLFNSIARLNRPDPRLSEFSERQITIMITALEEFRKNNPASLMTDMDSILEIDVQLHSAFQKVKEMNNVMQN